MSKASISLIQTALRDLGYQPGPVDGLFGPKTRGAAEAWLTAAGAARSSAIAPVTSAMIHQGTARYPVGEIVVHCSATRPEWMAGFPLQAQVDEIRTWHRAQGWRDIGYHWIVGRKGQVLSGRPETQIGAGVVGHNNGVIHVCLIGGHGSSESDRFSDHFSAAQDVTLRQLIQGISMRTQIRRISGHNEYAAKACPGFNVTTWLKEVA